MKIRAIENLTLGHLYIGFIIYYNRRLAIQPTGKNRKKVWLYPKICNSRAIFARIDSICPEEVSTQLKIKENQKYYLKWLL
jgi:hypothetical protein